MCGDDEAVRNGDDDGESGADLELFRHFFGGIATLRLPEQNSKAVQRQPTTFGSLHRKIKCPGGISVSMRYGLETKRRISYYHFSQYLIKCIEGRRNQPSNGIFYK